MAMESLAVGMGEKMWDTYHEQNMQKMQYEYNKRLNRQMSELAAEARRQSAADAVEGARRAGLHPLAALGLGFGSVSSGGGVSAPTSSANQGLGRLTLEQSRFEDAELGLIEAQTNKTNAEAGNINIQSGEMQARNDAANRLLSEHLNYVVNNSSTSAAEKAYAQSLLANSKGFNSGSVQAYSEFGRSLTSISAGEADSYANRLAAYVSGLQLMRARSSVEGEAFRNWVSKLPEKQAEAVSRSVDEMIAHTILLRAMAYSEDAKPDLIDAQIKELNKQVQYLGRMIRNSKNHDVVDMWENGRFGELFVYEADHVVNSLAGSGGAFLGGLLGSKFQVKRNAPKQTRLKGLTGNSDF